MKEILTLQKGNPEEASDMDKARLIGDTLSTHYPGHLWVVTVQGRAIIVRNGAVNARFGPLGFVLKNDDTYSHKRLRRNAIMAGGELLERANMKHSWDGSLPDSFDRSGSKNPV